MQVIEIAIYGIALSQLNVINFIYFIFFNLFINSVFFNKTLPNVPQIITACQKHSKLINTCVNKYKKLNDVLQISIILFKLLFIYIFRYLFNYNAYGIRIITNNFVNKLKIYHEINNNNSMNNIFLTDITNKNLTDESTETSDDSEQYNITEYDNDSTDGEQENKNENDEGYYEDSDTEKEPDEEQDEEPDEEQDEEPDEEQDEEDYNNYPTVSTNDVSTPETLDNEPSSFESSDSKSRMLLNNLPKGEIVNEPYQATLDELGSLPVPNNNPYTFYNYIFSFFKYV